MTTLSRDRRRELENTIRAARRVAEDGARKALDHLAVSHHEPRGHLSPDQRKLRNRLRARARQLGDRLDARGYQEVGRLVEQCAYEHWHRILFARFLAENGLLIHPESGQPISLQDCRELAAEAGKDWLTVASEYAVRMLPQVFRPDDPVLEVALPPEARQELERLLEELAIETFMATDSLGWTYQFWQAERKDAINASEKKIGAEELGPVTQLFTEDYMVDFLLHNTLGAWWAGKQEPIQANSEEEARAKVSLAAWSGLPAVTWHYLRFLQNDDGSWRPAAGTFDGWPKVAAEITVLDPSMGSGHFLVFALPILARIRAQEEHLTGPDALVAVLRDNLHGLELDERCTQIAAFNLGLATWRLGGYQQLPGLHVACSGLSLSATEKEWVALASGAMRLEAGMMRLYQLFSNGPTFGSLIDPRSEGLDLLEADFGDLAPLLERAVAAATDDAVSKERAAAAQGIVKAAELLAGTFTLVTTNVPYLGRGKQDETIRDYCGRRHTRAKADLATCFVERCLRFCSEGGTSALVTPQNWLFQASYKELRKSLLDSKEWNCVARLGAHAFETITGEVVKVALIALTNRSSRSHQALAGLNADGVPDCPGKKDVLSRASVQVTTQESLAANVDHIITFAPTIRGPRLSDYAVSVEGLSTGDKDRFLACFWETDPHDGVWEPFQVSPSGRSLFDGMHLALRWEAGRGELVSSSGARIQGQSAWGRTTIVVGQMTRLTVALTCGARHDKMTGALIPKREEYLLPILAFCTSEEYNHAVRELTPKLNAATGTLVKVAFNLSRWQEGAQQKYPQGLPKPHSNDPSQWIFDGSPRGSTAPLQVAVSILAGYRWPRLGGSALPNRDALERVSLPSRADSDGILCLPALQHEPPAATRLRSLLAEAFGPEWHTGAERQLLSDTEARSSTLEEWLENEFFEQHCTQFYQRPFVWQIWDGVSGGFSALVNYHKLAGADGTGRRTLEKLTHTYLGDWIARQQADLAAHADGAETRLAAAEHLRTQLEKIIEGEPPYDLFIRWKPLHEQPIGWDPDINDGVRLNIRPFMTARSHNARAKATCILRSTPHIKWSKDRGTEPRRPKEDYPWFWNWDEVTTDFMGGKEFDGGRWNDLHYSNKVKRQAREAASRRTTGHNR